MVPSRVQIPTQAEGEPLGPGLSPQPVPIAASELPAQFAFPSNLGQSVVGPGKDGHGPPTVDLGAAPSPELAVRGVASPRTPRTKRLPSHREGQEVHEEGAHWGVAELGPGRGTHGLPQAPLISLTPTYPAATMTWQGAPCSEAKTRALRSGASPQPTLVAESEQGSHRTVIQGCCLFPGFILPEIKGKSPEFISTHSQTGLECLANIRQ